MMWKLFLEKKPTPLIILFFGVIIRLFGLFSRPIWYDEAFSLLFANTSPSAMIYGTLTLGNTGSADIHPLGYYFILWAWMHILGNGIVAARLLSIFISVFSLILIYQIAKHLFNEKIGEISLFLACILPFQVHYAQEIRMYALLEFFLLLATFSYLKGKKGHWAWWVLFSVSSVAAQFTHNLAAFYLIVLAATPIFEKDRKTLKLVIFAGLFAILLYIPWLIHLPSQLSKVNTSYWVERPGLEKIFTLFLFYLPHLPLPNKFLLSGLLISTTIVALAIFQTVASKKKKLQNLNHGEWLAYLAFTPPTLLWLVSQIIPIYIERVLLPSHAMFCIWLAWVFTQTEIPKMVRILSFGLIFIAAVIGIFQHLTYTGFPYAHFYTLDRKIKTELQVGDVIVHSSKLSYLPSYYFDPEILQGYITDPSGSTTDTLAPATQEILGIQAYQDIQTATKNNNRVWFIIYQQSINEFTLQGRKIHPQLDFLNKNFALTSTEQIDDLTIYLYIRK